MNISNHQSIFRGLQRILLIDNHPVVQAGFETILKKSSLKYILEVSDSFSQGIEKLKTASFQLVVLEIDERDTTISHLLTQIKTLNSQLKILIFTGQDEHIYAYPALQMGADGFVSKSASHDEIILAMISILRNETYVSKEIQQQIFSNWSYYNKSTNPILSLSERETDVLLLLLEGYTTSEISHRLNLQPSTISTYKNRLYKKMDVSNVLELVTKARELKAMEKID